MLLQSLKNKLIVVTGTSIGEVFFDYQAYQNEVRSKTYPCVLWLFDGMKFTEDIRTGTIQKTKLLTVTVFAVNKYTPGADKITAWDTLEGYFKTYMNVMNDTAGLQIMNIDKINGQYAGEGMVSGDQEIGIIYRDVLLKLFCS